MKFEDLDLIVKVAKEYDLDRALIAAMVQKETRGVRWRTRFEPHTDKYLVFYREHASQLGISQETERTHQKTSWGLMQVMGFVARELGFKGYLVELTGAELGLTLGCRKLRQLLNKYSETDAIAAYNMGSPRKTKGLLYENQKTYMDPIFQFRREWEEYFKTT
jgi:soluble lytic murein transglycosylase-like protein